MVEFALVFPLVVLVLLTVAEIVVVARTQIEVVAAAREGARQLATDPDPERAVAAVRSALGETGRDARVSLVRPNVVGATARVTVVVRHLVAPAVAGGVAVDLRASAAMRVER